MKKIIEKAWRDGFDSGLSCCGICTNTKENKLFEKWSTENDADATPPTPTKEGLHTQGEWAVRPRGNDNFYDNGAFVSIYSKELGLEGGNICSIYSPSDKTNSHKPTDEQKANAELIVKAVNERQALLDSNKQLIAIIEQEAYLGNINLDKHITAINNAKNIKQ